MNLFQLFLITPDGLRPLYRHLAFAHEGKAAFFALRQGMPCGSFTSLPVWFEFTRLPDEPETAQP